MVVALVFGFQAHQYYQSKTATDLYSEISQKKTSTFSETILGTKRPDFSLMDLQGQERHVTEWDGKTLVVNFWATWCPPCLEEIPEFIRLQDEFAADGLQFLGIALQTAEEVQPFYDEVGMNYPTLVGQEKVIRLAKSLGNDMGALPYTVIIDSSGEIHFVKLGPLATEKARQIIQSLL